MAQSAPTIKKLSMELGGNALFIVFDDADLDAGSQSQLKNCCAPIQTFRLSAWLPKTWTLRSVHA